jgi:hypothetical protein
VAIVTRFNSTNYYEQEGKAGGCSKCLQHTIIPQAIKYLHAAAGFPTKDTWVKAIKSGNYVSWSGLTVDVVNIYFPEAIKTQKGHIKKQRQNI